MKESEIEKKVCEYAKGRGWLTYKFVSPSNKGVPDRVLLKRGVCIFIEFKAKGKLPTKLQAKVLASIHNQGFLTYVVDNVEEGKKIIDNYL